MSAECLQYLSDVSLSGVLTDSSGEVVYDGTWLDGLQHWVHDFFTLHHFHLEDEIWLRFLCNRWESNTFLMGKCTTESSSQGRKKVSSRSIFF